MNFRNCNNSCWADFIEANDLFYFIRAVYIIRSYFARGEVIVVTLVKSMNIVGKKIDCFMKNHRITFRVRTAVVLLSHGSSKHATTVARPTIPSQLPKSSILPFVA